MSVSIANGKHIQDAIPIQDLAWLISPRDQVVKPLVLIAAYLDESGDPEKQRFLGVGGWLASQRDWIEFERLWHLTEHKMRKRGAVYHTTDLESTFGDFKGWDHHECKEIVRKMAEAVSTPQIYGVNASVDIAAFKRVFPKDGPHSPYFLCFQSCILQLAELAASVRETVAFVFDDQQDLEHQAKRLYDRIKRDINSEDARWLGSITFGSRAQYLGLQAADFIAYESYKLIDYSARTNRVRRSLRRIAESKRLQGRLWLEPQLLELREIVRQSGFPTAEEFVTAELSHRRADRVVDKTGQTVDRALAG